MSKYKPLNTSARAGQMDRRITIEKATVTQSTSGAETIVWSTRATVWASKEVVQRGMSQSLEADQILSITEYLFTIRDTDGVNAKDRILDGGVYYDIMNVKRPNRRFIELQTAERV